MKASPSVSRQKRIRAAARTPNPAGHARGRRPRGAGRTSEATSRTRILAAAAAEFAARGFAGTGVDRIADRAGLNKAMIYYHFKSKTALYHEVLREMFRATGERVSRIAAASHSPEERLEAFIAAIADEAARRPHFPPILLRELAEDGRHLDNTTVSLLQVMPRSLMAILEEGIRSGHFRRVNPLFAYSTLVGPVMFYLASAPLRARIARTGLPVFEGPGLQPFVEHVQAAMLASLRPGKPAASERRRGDEP